ncbi:hypothetical protein FKP32DRAFT_752321 [Trametes sanguinea]|nr:hypothetical protein FKP32DRAFT_752321 [Trametes sanguinea]
METTYWRLRVLYLYSQLAPPASCLGGILQFRPESQCRSRHVVAYDIQARFNHFTTTLSITHKNHCSILIVITGRYPRRACSGGCHGITSMYHGTLQCARTVKILKRQDRGRAGGVTSEFQYLTGIPQPQEHILTLGFRVQSYLWPCESGGPCSLDKARSCYSLLCLQA